LIQRQDTERDPVVVHHLLYAGSGAALTSQQHPTHSISAASPTESTKTKVKVQENTEVIVILRGHCDKRSL
jgi:hypothetical protein